VSADENTRLAQSAYEAFGRGDMPALAEVMADDIEWVIPGDPDNDPNAGTFARFQLYFDTAAAAAAHRVE